MWVPVSRRTSRIRWTSKRRGSTSAWCFSPLMETWTCIVPTSSTCSSGPLQGSMERPDGQDAHEILLVLDGPAEIGGRLSSVGGQPGGLLDRLGVGALA